MNAQLGLFEKLFEKENKINSLIHMGTRVLGNNNYLVNRMLATASTIDQDSEAFFIINRAVDKALFTGHYIGLYIKLLLANHKNDISKKAIKELNEEIDNAVHAAHTVYANLNSDLKELVKHIDDVVDRFAIVAKLTDREFGETTSMVNLVRDVIRTAIETKDYLYQIDYALQG